MFKHVYNIQCTAFYKNRIPKSTSWKQYHIHISRHIISERLAISRNLASIGDKVRFGEQIKKYLFSKSEILAENVSVLIFVLKNASLN